MDIRWEQRFDNYVRAFEKLSQSVAFIHSAYGEELDDENFDSVLSEMIKEGLIQRFEYTHELAWKVMKDYAAFQGNPNISGSRDAIREAFQMQLIHDGTTWMDMIESRNKTSHTYNESTANEIFKKILNDYFPVFLEFRNLMEEKRTGNQLNLF